MTDESVKKQPSDQGARRADKYTADLLAGEAAEKFVNDNNNLDLARDHFIEQYKQKVSDGTVWAKSRATLAAEQAWKQANSRARHRADRLIIEIALGQSSFDELSLDLGLMIVVGKGRRATLRTLKVVDIRLMCEVREANRTQVNASTDIFVDAAEKVISIIEKYANFGAAFKAGVVAKKSEKSA